jgi:hypothetical protein
MSCVSLLYLLLEDEDRNIFDDDSSEYSIDLPVPKFLTNTCIST